MADGLVQPAFLHVPDEFDPERTLGPHVAALGTLAGFPPDPEQRFMLDVSFALDKQGKPLISRTVVIAPRQNLKTGFAKLRTLGKQFILQRRLQVWSAHEFNTSKSALEDLEGLIDNCPDLRRKVALSARGKVATHGAAPEIKLLPKYNSATVAFKTRTSGGARGLTGDDLTVDEAFAVQAAQMGAVLPIMLARPDSQVDFLSSACRPESKYLWDLIKWCRAGADGRTFYIEWCAPPPAEVCDDGADCTHERHVRGCGCDKHEVIRLAHTALTRGRITMDKIRAMRTDLPPAEYAREIMGWHDEPVDQSLPIEAEDWEALQDPASRLTKVSAFGVEVSLDRAWSAIGVAGPRDKTRTHVELLPWQRGGDVYVTRGTNGLVARCKQLNADQGPAVFVLDGAGEAAAFRADLERAGLEVVVMSTGDVAAGSSALAEAVKDKTVSPHGPRPELVDEIRGAAKRDLGDGKWTFGRRVSTRDITGLLAVRNAYWYAVCNRPYNVLNSIY